MGMDGISPVSTVFSFRPIWGPAWYAWEIGANGNYYKALINSPVTWDTFQDQNADNGPVRWGTFA